MIKIYVCVVTNPGSTKMVFESLNTVEGVKEHHEVMGPYDIMVEAEVEGLQDVPALLNKIRDIPGIETTVSLVTFPKN